MDTSLLVNRALALLEDESRAPAYAILDGARDPRIHPLVTGSGLRHQCLFAGRLAPELLRAAPYLIELDREGSTARRLLLPGWGQSWGVLFTSKAPFEQVRAHLRRFLRVQDEEGNRLFFRYYDPRVLRAYLPTCREAELDVVFGPITRYVVEAKEPGQILEYRRDGAALGIERHDLAS